MIEAHVLKQEKNDNIRPRQIHPSLSFQPPRWFPSGDVFTTKIIISNGQTARADRQASYVYYGIDM